MDSFDKGDLVRITATFRNAADALTDPTSVTFRHQSPSGTTTSKTFAAGEVTRDSLGVFYYEWVPDASGMWSWRFEGTGAVAQVDEGEFMVLLSDF